MEKQKKKFKLGNLKKYALVAVASAALLGTPSRANAQDNGKTKTEVFDLKKASERDFKLYAAIVDVLAVKFPAEETALRAAKIMNGKTEFNEKQANTYIRFMVEQMMGPEFKEEFARAKREVDGAEANVPQNLRGEDDSVREKFARENEKTHTPDRELRRIQTGFGAFYYELQSEGYISNVDYDQKAFEKQNSDKIAELAAAIGEYHQKRATKSDVTLENLARRAIVENLIYQDIIARQAQGETVPGGKEYQRRFIHDLPRIYGLDITAEGGLTKHNYNKENAAPTITITKDKFGTEEKTVTEKDGVITTTVKSEKTFKITDLTPQELMEYNTMYAKIKVSRELRDMNQAGTMMLAQNVFLSSENRDKLFNIYVGDIKFRDLDDASFVAFNPKTGQGKIHARGDLLSKAKKQIKKAGGIENFVMSAQQTKTKTPKAARKIPLMTLDGNIH